MNEMGKKRRELMRMIGVMSGGAAIAGWGSLAAAAKAPVEQEDVSPGEDLMREHGLLNRILLIYEEAVWRLEGHSALKPELLARSAGIIRRFVEDYHERLEEDYLFPRFEEKRLYTDLVSTLRAQHQAGRRLTDEVLRLTKGTALRGGDKRALKELLRAFIRMYRPHEAREDTVLFPAFHKIVSSQEYDLLGDKFEDKENQLFSNEGFEKNVDEVTAIERELGIYDLAQFTPRT